MNDDQLKSTYYEACCAWVLRYGRHETGGRWRVPIDALRSVVFDLPPFDGMAPPAPFPYPLPLEGSPLAVFAVWEKWDCESGGREALKRSLQKTSEWHDAVAVIRKEIQDWRRRQIIGAMFSEAADEGDEEDFSPIIIDENHHIQRQPETVDGWLKQLNCLIFSPSPEATLARNGLPSTPDTQRFLVFSALKAFEKASALQPIKLLAKNETAPLPSRGVRYLSVCLAPRHKFLDITIKPSSPKKRRKPSENEPAEPQPLTFPIINGNVIWRYGDVVTTVTISAGARDSLKNVQREAGKHRADWQKKDVAPLPADLRKQNSSDSWLLNVPGVEALLVEAFKDGSHVFDKSDPKNVKREILRTKLFNLCRNDWEAKNGSKRTERAVWNAAQSQFRRWSTNPPNF